MLFQQNNMREQNKVEIYFNENLNYHPLAHHMDTAHKNLHSAAIKAKEFLDFGLESQKNAKKKENKQ
jgi:hypothetical protein